MAKLTPVDGNPFETAPSGGRMTPVEGNPFEGPAKPTSSFAPRVAREGMPVNRKVAMREEIDRTRFASDNPLGKIATAWRSGVGMVPFADDAVAGLATLFPTNQFDLSLPEKELFARNRDYVEAQHESDWANDKVSSIVGGGAAAIASPGGAYIAGAKSLPSLMKRAGEIGGVYGTLTGASSNGTVEERGEQAVKQGALGALVGAVAPPLTRGVGYVANEAVMPFVDRVRNRMNPDAATDRMLGNALRADRAAGQRMPDAVLNTAEREGLPMVLGDVGGETTYAVGRAAANASPIARGTLTEALDPRYNEQQRRFGTFISNMFDYPDPMAMTERLKVAGRMTNSPAYKALYDDFPMVGNDDLLDMLRNVPEVRAAAEEVMKRTPGLQAAGMSTGRMSTGPMPSIEFWDRTQRLLRDKSRNAFDAKENTLGELYGSLRERMVGQLDRLTGGRFEQVRGGAARFFGAEDAIEAGQLFFKNNKLMDMAGARKALESMDPAQRNLFAQGFAAEMAHATGGLRPNQNLSVQSWATSPNAMEKLRIAFGPERAEQVSMVVTAETAMNRLRDAVKGNSTSVRQLIESGVLGAGLNTYLSGEAGWSSFSSPEGIMLALARGWATKNKGMSPAMAENLARKLVSNDPRVVAKVFARAKKDADLRSFLRGFEGMLVKVGAVQGDEVISDTPRQGYAEGGMVTEPKTGDQYYGPGYEAAEADRRELERMSPGGERYVAPPAVTYPGEELQDRYKDKLPLDIMVPRNAVDIIDTDIGAYPVDIEGKRLDWVKRPGMVPVARDQTGSYPVMPALVEQISNMAGGGTEGAGMVVSSGFRLPGKAKPVRAATQAAGAAPDVARVADDLALPPPAAAPLEDAAARVELPPPLARGEPAAPVASEEMPPPLARGEPTAPEAPAAAPTTPAAGGTAEFHLDVERGTRATANKIRLNADETAEVVRLAKTAGVDPEAALEVWRETRMKYPTTEWEPIQPFKIVKDKNGEFEFEAREIPFAFNKDKAAAASDRAEALPDPELVRPMARKLAREVLDVAARAEKGDENAGVIMGARTWYKAMRDRLRAEYGSFADVFADVLGTTSAQTNVRQNWDNASEALTNFTSGMYDDVLTRMDEWFKKGGVIGNAKIDENDGYLANGWVNNHQRIKNETMPSALEQAKAEGLDGKAADARAKDIAFDAAQKEFPLITKSDGRTLFNANSPATMEAFLDLFRQVKPGDAPKTPNFTGNLIGYSQKATIDVWAARLLRRLSGRKPVPSIAQKGVGGDHMADVSQVSGEFGFGQEVFKQAADMLRKDPRFKDLGDDDLQAIVWFLEKENWTKKGWTNKAGEGGSMEYEANLAGIPDRKWVSEQRRLINTDPTAKRRKELAAATEDPTPRNAAERRLAEIDWTIKPFPNGKMPTKVNIRDRIMQEQGITTRNEAMDMAEALLAEAKQAARTVRKFDDGQTTLARLTEEAETTKSGATRALDAAASTVRRMIGGLSPNRTEYPATDVMFATGSERLTDILKNDPSVLASKATPTKGRYIDREGKVYDERSYDLELVTRRNFDPQPLWQQMVREAKRRNQDSVFLSEVVPAGSMPDANPGVEIFFTKKVDESVADAITRRVNELGIDAGFTYAVDVRQANRAAQKAGKDATEFVGIRVQYIPEFGGGLEGRQTAMEKMLDLVQELTKAPGVSNSRYVEYDTQVAFGSDYDAILAGSVSDGRQAAWGRQRRGEGVAGPDGGGGLPQGDVGGAPVHRRRGGPATRTQAEKRARLSKPVDQSDDALHEYLMATVAPPVPRRFAMGGPVFPAAVNNRIGALSRRH
jgi:hypothetical protein